MIETRRKLLRDLDRNRLAENNSIPEMDEPNEELPEEQPENQIIASSIRDSRNSEDLRLHGRHNLKTYSDMGRAIYGDFGYYSVNVVIFAQQLTVITAYFYFLNKYFPSYLVLVIIIPICMF